MQKIFLSCFGNLPADRPTFNELDKQLHSLPLYVRRTKTKKVRVYWKDSFSIFLILQFDLLAHWKFLHF